MNAISRRGLLAAGGALVVAFSTRGRAEGALPGSLARTPSLSGWIRVAPSGAVTVFTGKAELGQGIRTALTQVAAEQLDVAFEAVTLVTADTARTPDEGFTSGSLSMKDSGTAILNAAAEVRALLVAEAAKRWGADASVLTTAEGRVQAPDGRSLGYGELAATVSLDRRATATAKLKDPRLYRVMGRPRPRLDIPAKVTGGVAYVHDLRLPGMVHARVVRQPSYGATLVEADIAGVEAMPGVLKVVRDGSYLAVIAGREWEAVLAMYALARSAKWEAGPALADPATIWETIRALPAQPTVIAETSAPVPEGARVLQARYRRPYGMHGSIGPSCAVGLLEGDTTTVWTHTQGVYPDRAAIAELLGVPMVKLRCIHMEGSGCYGHNGADDAAADAAVLARAMPGRPVRVQWMREQEHSWEPFTPAMIAEARAALDGQGRVVDWQYGVWSNTHSMRPGNGGRLIPAWAMEKRIAPAPPAPIPQPEGGGDRNAIPLYAFPSRKVTSHFIAQMPLRVSAMRGLGAYTNVFAIESFMDELAAAAGQDPVAFRLAHLSDPRAADVVRLAAARFGWDGPALPQGHGRGFAFAKYKNLAAYCAVAVEIEVLRDSGQVRVLRANLAVDCGDAVNPDGIRNQIQGGFVQSTSWTLYEEVTWDSAGITSRDWGRYPILRFDGVPQSVDVEIIDRPGQPFLGVGEASQGPTAAALANALADATKLRLRDLPLSPRRVKAALAI